MRAVMGNKQYTNDGLILITICEHKQWVHVRIMMHMYNRNTIHYIVSYAVYIAKFY